MINQEMNVHIENKMPNAKQIFKKYVSMESSCGYLMEVARNSFFISIGINEINDGIKNPKRFKITKLHLIYFAISDLILILFSAFNYFHASLMADILPAQFRIVFSLVTIGFTWFSIVKFDMFSGELKFNLSPLKVFYSLINNIKSIHKLTDSNYNRLAILSRITEILVMDSGSPIVCFSLIILTFLIAVLSKKFIWIFLAIHFIPSIILACTAFLCWICMVLILISYYKMRFDQIHSSIKSIVSNGKWSVINKRREKQLKNLIEEHKSVSNEIHKVNLMLRRSVGAMFIALSMNRVNTLYVLINFENNIFVVLMLSITSFLIFTFGFGLTYLFSHQIKSAHQNYKLIYSILCKFNMKLRFRFKVI